MGLPIHLDFNAKTPVSLFSTHLVEPQRFPIKPLARSAAPNVP